ncbi:helix-turn-helix transcriptional regulator [Solwaraspora sp. WMMD1047]|uniref:helix-turn-helix domain-containing protein n=1 Tax=Solwaraspora sp. WMMD1047 TaxID=3016102 RepID=UPI002417E459|nr:helix-turn-helix transcriptional regulator [Solwaraspora sp. WMMD1047]MDG4834685.1 helix-turn-helix transcriptional regulator [Solwaraspora sp. WMMD1047]
MSNNGVPRILKFLRAQAGMTQEQLAERLSVSTSLIAKFETGRLIPMADTARMIDGVVNSGNLVQETSAEARKGVPPEWFQPWPEVERDATAIRWHDPSIIPGLLQTERYARSVLTSGLLTAAQSEEFTAHRLGRQSTVFDRDDPPLCQFVIDECALRRGDRDILIEQLQWLIEIGTRPRVFIHVIPASAGLHVGLSGPFMLATLPDGRSVGFVDDQLEGRLITSTAKVVALDRAWQALSAVILPRDLSRDLIKKIASEL